MIYFDQIYVYKNIENIPNKNVLRKQLSKLCTVYSNIPLF